MIGRLFARKEPRSLLDALSLYLTRAQRREVRAQVRDPRMLAAEAAQILGVSEKRLLRDMANRFGFPLLSVVSPFLSALLPSGCTHRWLQGEGIAAITYDGNLHGFVCVDPFSAASRLAALGFAPGQGGSTEAPYYLGAWNEIRSALIESENDPHGERGAEYLTLARIVGVVVSRAYEVGARDLLLEFRLGQFEYSLISADGRFGRGVVDVNFTELFRRSLGARKQMVVPLWSGAIGRVRVEVIEPASAFRLKLLSADGEVGVQLEESVVVQDEKQGGAIWC